jgi:hypothetical protein
MYGPLLMPDHDMLYIGSGQLIEDIDGSTTRHTKYGIYSLFFQYLHQDLSPG